MGQNTSPNSFSDTPALPSVGWCYPAPSKGWGHVANAPWNSNEVPKNLRRMEATSTHSNSGHPITAQVVTIDWFSSVASYYSMGGRLHSSVPVKHWGHYLLASNFRFREISGKFFPLGYNNINSD